MNDIKEILREEFIRELLKENDPDVSDDIIDEYIKSGVTPWDAVILYELKNTKKSVDTKHLIH